MADPQHPQAQGAQRRRFFPARFGLLDLDEGEGEELEGGEAQKPPHPPAPDLVVKPQDRENEGGWQVHNQLGGSKLKLQAGAPAVELEASGAPVVQSQALATHPAEAQSKFAGSDRSSPWVGPALSCGRWRAGSVPALSPLGGAATCGLPDRLLVSLAEERALDLPEFARLDGLDGVELARPALAVRKGADKGADSAPAGSPPGRPEDGKVQRCMETARAEADCQLAASHGSFPLNVTETHPLPSWVMEDARKTVQGEAAPQGDCASWLLDSLEDSVDPAKGSGHSQVPAGVQEQASMRQPGTQRLDTAVHSLEELVAAMGQRTCRGVTPRSVGSSGASGLGVHPLDMRSRSGGPSSNSHRLIAERCSLRVGDGGSPQVPGMGAAVLDTLGADTGTSDGSRLGTSFSGLQAGDVARSMEVLRGLGPGWSGAGMQGLAMDALSGAVASGTTVQMTEGRGASSSRSDMDLWQAQLLDAARELQRSCAFQEVCQPGTTLANGLLQAWHLRLLEQLSRIGQPASGHGHVPSVDAGAPGTCATPSIPGHLEEAPGPGVSSTLCIPDAALANLVPQLSGTHSWGEPDHSLSDQACRGRATAMASFLTTAIVGASLAAQERRLEQEDQEGKAKQKDIERGSGQDGRRGANLINLGPSGSQGPSGSAGLRMSQHLAATGGGRPLMGVWGQQGEHQHHLHGQHRHEERQRKNECRSSLSQRTHEQQPQDRELLQTQELQQQPCVQHQKQQVEQRQQKQQQQQQQQPAQEQQHHQQQHQRQHQHQHQQQYQHHHEHRLNEQGPQRQKEQQQQRLIIPPSMRGALSSSWVHLGQDLWRKGVTLGMECFLDEVTPDEPGAPATHLQEAPRPGGPNTAPASSGPPETLPPRDRVRNGGQGVNVSRDVHRPQPPLQPRFCSPGSLGCTTEGPCSTGARAQGSQCIGKGIGVSMPMIGGGDERAKKRVALPLQSVAAGPAATDCTSSAAASGGSAKSARDKSVPCLSQRLAAAINSIQPVPAWPSSLCHSTQSAVFARPHSASGTRPGPRPAWSQEPGWQRGASGEASDRNVPGGCKQQQQQQQQVSDSELALVPAGLHDRLLARCSGAEPASGSSSLAALGGQDQGPAARARARARAALAAGSVSSSMHLPSARGMPRPLLVSLSQGLTMWPQDVQGMHSVQGSPLPCTQGVGMSLAKGEKAFTASPAGMPKCLGLPAPGLAVDPLVGPKQAGSVAEARRSLCQAVMDKGPGGAAFQRLVTMAQALEQGNKALFMEVQKLLKPLAKPRGGAGERVLHFFLHSLILRAQGAGFAAINSPSKRTFQELDNGRMWYYTGSPICPFGALAVTGILLPKLRGKRHVHIVDMGQTMLPQWPAVMKLLAHGGGDEAGNANGSSSGSGGSSGGSGGSGGRDVDGASRTNAHHAPLQRLHITFLDSSALANPGRTDFKSVKGTARVGQVLQGAAAALGIDFSFDGVELSEDTLDTLDLIRRRDEDALVVSVNYDLKYYADEPTLGGGARQKALQFMKRLKPDMIAMVDLDQEATHGSFLPRFQSSLADHLAVFDLNDSLVQQGGRKLMQNFEEVYWGRDIGSIVACEGRERRIHPLSYQLAAEQLLSWGFCPIPVKQRVANAAMGMLQSYPPGFSLLHDDDGALRMTWQGVPFAFASAWTAASRKRLHGS